MKKPLLLLLLLVNSLTTLSQTVTYTENSSIISNPERGLQKYSKTGSTYHSNLTSNINVSSWNGYRTGPDKVTVIYRYFMLEQFLNSDINNTYLTNMQTDFDRIRQSGLKVIVRFAYTESCNSSCDAGNIIQQPTKAQILTHITQVSPIINANKDIIFSIQAGFIGTWGEWYYTGNGSSFGHAGSITTAQYQNRKDVVDAMLNNFDTKIPLQLRYADAKRQMYGNTIPADFNQDRIGFYNDAFLNSYGDMGTYNTSGQFTNPVGTADYNFIANTSKFLPMTGETNGLNSPRTLGANAVLEMNLLNFTTLNRDYFTQNWNNWIASGHYEEILKRLGYRFILTSSTLSDNTLTLNIFNDGFASVLSEKNVYIIYRQGATDIKRLVNEDVRYWQKGANTVNIALPTDLTDGSYELLLHIADKNLELKPEYSIQFANSNLWESSTGYNKLNQNFEIASTCTLTSTWNGNNWSPAVLPSETRNVVINGSYDTELNGSFDCCNLTVNGNLTISTADFVTVQNHIEVLGTLLVKNGGKLIPVNDTSTSNGIISVERRTTSMKRYDYTYWSSPVSTTIGQALGTWQNNYTFEFKTPNFIDTQTHINGVFQSNIPDGQDDAAPFAWTLVSQSDNMISGKGYAAMIKSLPNTPIYPRTELVTFIGELNTGIITIPLEMSGNNSSSNDDFNLVGNPYSSSIKANDFINENLPNISGTLAYWTHVGTLGSTYPGLLANNFSTSDYAYYNLLGGTASAGTLGTPSGFGGKIPTSAIGNCQGFLVEAQNSVDLIFKPSFMDKVVDNTTPIVFFKTNETEDKKVWLNLSTQLVLFTQQLIGYNTNTTLGYEKGWDFIEKAPRQALTFYSIENGVKYKIQARGDFDITDNVKLGFKTEVPETFTISIDSIIGIENIYIKDYGVTYNLPYTFTSEIGEYNDRFELIYQTSLTGVDFSINSFYIYPNSTKDYVNIVGSDIKNYKINLYNLSGQKLNVTIDDNKLNMKHLSSGLYILEIRDGNIKQTFKIIKK